ncbi:MAG: triose-phosphate isomerase [bacterium JZ-2024 1]
MPLVAANWKMMMTQRECISFLRDPIWKDIPGDVEVSIHPQTAHIWLLREMIHRWGMAIGAQDCHWELRGPFTGETSVLSLAEAGVKYVIIGHSERRRYFGETNDRVNAKVRRALAEGLHPILCVGETLKEREEGQVFEVLKRQWETGLNAIDATAVGRLAAAYEPVWAIGTGRNADADSVSEVVAFLRDIARAQWGERAQSLRILYGGSVTHENVEMYARLAGVSGALVGSASTQPAPFFKILCAFSRFRDTATG